MERLTRLSLERPLAALTLLGIATLVLGAGLLRIDTDVGYRALLGSEHPAVARFDAFLERFGGGFPVAAVYACEQTPRCESVFDAAAVAMAADVGAALAREPTIRRVESVATSPLLVPGGGAPQSRTFLADAGTPERRAWLARRALEDSLWPRRLIDETGRVGAVVIEVASSRSGDSEAAYAALDAALAPHEAAGWRFHRVGGPVEFVVAGGELQADTLRLVPAMVLLVAVTLFAFFHSPGAVAAGLVSVGVGVLWAMGLHGWLGWAQNSVTQALPPLLLVVGVCDTIHVLARYASEGARHKDASRPELLLQVARDVGGPCVATSLTTAAGFASFAGADLESFARFGLVASFGVLVALLLTFTLLPILAVRVDPSAVQGRRLSARWDRALEATVSFAQRRRTPLLLLCVALLLSFGIGFGQLRVDASFEDLYGEDSRVVRWARFAADALRRPDTLEVEIIAREPDTASTLLRVQAIARRLADIEGLGPARSLVDVVSLVHQLANDDEPFWHRVPGRDADVREILRMAEERDAAGVARWWDRSRDSLRISLESEKPPQEEMRRIFAEVDAVLEAELPPDWQAELTGPLAVVHEMVDEIQRVQLESFALATGIVLVLVAVFLGSPVYALLALVPTLLPVIVTLGAMGFAGVNLDVGSAMVAAVVIGIAVDDAIHLLAMYRRALARGKAADDAMRDACVHVGRAVVSTSLALSIGFAALTLSSWHAISSFGALASVAILGALAADLLILPALVSVVGIRTGRRRRPLR